MKTIKQYVGVDISKEYFDVSLPTGSHYLHHQFSNNPKGFKDLLKLLPSDASVVMEASGTYYLQLAFYLHEKGVSVSVVNPLVIRRFCQMRMVRTKTDKKDAQMIAEYGKTEQPASWEPPAAYMLELKQMQAVIHQLKKQQSALQRQKEAFKHSPFVSKVALHSIDVSLQTNSNEQEHLEKEMQLLIQEHHGQMHQNIQTIPGIGKKAALLLIAISNGFTKFQTAKQLCSYLGVCPRIYESGKSVRGKAKITKMGAGGIRAILYLCSWSAIKYNKACKELYERLLEKGKPKMVALIAVVNKLIRQAFAIATKGVLYKEI
jgi:transposase